MKDKDKTKEQLINELDKMRKRTTTLEAECKQVGEYKQAILNTSPDLLAIIDREWNIFGINKAMSDRFGKQPEELIGTNCRDLLPQELVKSRNSYFEEVFRTGKPCRFQDENRGMYFDNIAYPILQEQGDIEQIAVIARDINQSALIYVYWEVEAGWIIPLPGETLMGVEGYIFDESNFELFKQGKDAHHISYGQLAIMGQMYGIAPEDGDYYIVFDNSQDTMRNMPFKTINYNVRSYVPAHEERIEKEGPVWIARSLYILFVGIILVGLLNIVWMKFKNRRDGSSIPPQDG